MLVFLGESVRSVWIEKHYLWYISARHNPSNSWETDSLNDSQIEKDLKGKAGGEGEKVEEKIWFEYKQTNKVEKRQQNTLNFWQQMKPDREEREGVTRCGEGEKFDAN